MHFTASETYVLEELSPSGEASADFVAQSVDALIALRDRLEEKGIDVAPGSQPLPTFVKLNGNAVIDRCLRHLMANGPGAQAKDWGAELYYIKKYGTDLLGRAGEQVREEYDKMEYESLTNPQIDPDFLRYTWLRHEQIDTFRDRSPGAYLSQPFSEAAFDEWWSTISSADFVGRALAEFAQAWVGSMKFIQDGEFFETLEKEARLLDYPHLAQFFYDFHHSILPPDWGITDDARH
jgi:hypothetical protein